jgi:hypothetical protein
MAECEIVIQKGKSMKNPRARMWSWCLSLVPMLGLLCSCSFLSQLFGLDEGTDRLRQGLVAYYPFDGNADDASMSGNDGTVLGATATADRFGTPSAAYDFDGIDDYVSIPDAVSLDPQDAMSAAAWFMLRSFSCPYPPIAKKSDATQSNGYSLECHFDPEDWDGSYLGPSVFFIVDLTGGGLDEYSGPTSISLDTWHFVAGTYDGTNEEIYLDGVLRNSHEYSGPMSTSPNDLEIGRDPSNPSRFFDGLIDEVRIYNRALTTSEVLLLYQSGDCEFPWHWDAVPSHP